MVLGSVEIFGDEWLDKEENAKLCDVLFSWLLNETDLDMTSDRQVKNPAHHLSDCLPWYMSVWISACATA